MSDLCDGTNQIHHTFAHAHAQAIPVVYPVEEVSLITEKITRLSESADICEHFNCVPLICKDACCTLCPVMLVPFG